MAANFVRQYYTVMTQRPEDLHRFHAGPSRLSHGTLSDFNEVGPDGLSVAVAAQGYEGVIPAVVSVAAQESVGGGLVILVTGTLAWPGKSASRFAHTFFLARQEKGFFVLNDILRLERGGSEAAKAMPVSKAVPAKNKASPPTTASFAAAQTAVLKASAPQATKQAAAPERKEEKETPVEDLTYAQRLKIAAKKESGAPAKCPAGLHVTTHSGGPKPLGVDAGVPPSLAGGGAPMSIFVRNLPVVVSQDQVLAHFSAFGPIRGGASGITIKAQKTNSYAFVDFETREAAAAAIGSALVLEGCELTVEEKKPQAPKAPRARGRLGKAGMVGGAANGRPRPAMNGGHAVTPHA